MANNDLHKERVKIAKELKAIIDKEGIAAAKLNDEYIRGLARLKEIKQTLEDTNTAYKKGMEEISKMNDGMSSMSSVYDKIKKSSAESAKLQTQVASSMAVQIERGDSISERNTVANTIGHDILANYREQQSLATQLAQLDDSQVIEKAKILDELDIYNQLLEEQLASLDKRTAVGKEFMSVNDKLAAETKGMVTEAKKLSSLSAKQKETLEEQAKVTDALVKKIDAMGSSITSIFSRPTALLGAMLRGIGKVIELVGKTTREMGGFVGGLTGATSQVTALKVIFPQALESAKGLSSEFGGLSDTSFETQFNTNLLATNLGVSGKEASQLVGQFARLNNGSIDTANNLIASTKELAKQKGLIPSQVMADVAGSAQAFAEYGKMGGTNIAEAAVAAGQLGSNLDGVTKVTNQLLDFESSINQELELGARLGKNINFQEARRLAYQGNIKGALQAALQQMGGIEAFNRMDIYQKRAAAAALGLSTEEMQKMLSNMDKLNDDGTVQLSTYDKMKESLTAIATGPLGSMVTYSGTFLATFGQANMGLAALNTSFGKIASSIWRGVKGLVMWPIQLAKAAAVKVGGLLGIGGDVAKTASTAVQTATKTAETASDVVSTGADAAKGATMGAKLTSLASGLTAMGTPQVLFGAANLIPTGLGFLAILPGIPGMLAVGAFGVKAGTGLIGLAAGLVAMNPTLAGAGALAIAGLGFTLMIPGAVGMGLVGLLGAYAGAGLIGLSAGLLAMTPTLLGSASLVAAALGFTLMIPGSVGMLLLGAAAPIAAFGIFTLIPALTALGVLMTSGVGALGIIALIGLGVGLGTTLALIGAGAMMLGKGIELATNGLNSFLPTLSTFMEGINLKQIGLIGLLSLAFMGLAGSLMLLGASGLFALPTLLGIAAASAGIAMVAEIFGLTGESGKAEETTAVVEGGGDTFETQVISEIKEVANAIRGLNLNIDGRRLNNAMTARESRSIGQNGLVIK